MWVLGMKIRLLGWSVRVFPCCWAISPACVSITWMTLGTSRKSDHMWLPSFPMHAVLKSHLCCSTGQSFLSSQGRMIIPTCRDHILSQQIWGHFYPLAFVNKAAWDPKCVTFICGFFLGRESLTLQESKISLNFEPGDSGSKSGFSSY